MYLVFFEGETSRRFDDAEEMGEAIIEYLNRHPHNTIKIVKYI